MNWNWLRSKTFWLILTTVAGFLLLVSFLPVGDWLTIVKDWLKTLGPWAMPMYIGVYLLAAIAGLPNILLILGAGTLFGFLQGIFAASVADTGSIAVCYLLGRTIARSQIKKIISKDSRFVQLDKALAKKGWKVVLLTRLSPVLPSSVLNYGFSLTKVNFWQYLFFSWLGMIPVIGLYVYVGAFGANLTDPERNPGGIILQVIGLAVTIGLVIYTTRMAKRILSQDEAEAAKAQGKA